MADNGPPSDEEVAVTRNLRFAIVAITLLAVGGEAVAHHSISMIELSKPEWVKGTIVRYAVVDPHVMIELEEGLANGKIRRWIVEGPRPARFDMILRYNGMSAEQAFLKVGQVISVCGFSLDKEYPPERMYTAWQPVDGRFLHGHVIGMPDGRMQSWGPYGKSDNCIRKGDQPRDWVEFLNRDRLARDLWCSGRTYSAIPSVASIDFLKEVDRRLSLPCD
jgi:hypothetical protein